MSGPAVAGEPAADRLMRSLNYRLHPGAGRLTRDQVAVALRLAPSAAAQLARGQDDGLRLDAAHVLGAAASCARCEEPLDRSALSTRCHGEEARR